jgi:hypothetical protein
MRGVASLTEASFHHCADSGIGARRAAGGALATVSLSLPSSLITLITRRLGLGRGSAGDVETGEEEEDADEEEVDAGVGAREEVGDEEEVEEEEAEEAEEELDEAGGPPARAGRKCACRKCVNPGPGPPKTPLPGDLRVASGQRVNPVPLREPCQE